MPIDKLLENERKVMQECAFMGFEEDYEYHREIVDLLTELKFLRVWKSNIEASLCEYAPKNAINLVNTIKVKTIKDIQTILDEAKQGNWYCCEEICPDFKCCDKCFYSYIKQRLEKMIKQ